MTNAPVEVITSVQRRRRWSAAEKEELVAATLEAGASVSAVARRAGIHPSQLYGWRRQLCGQPKAAPGFAPVRVTAEPGALSGAGVIDIEFASGVRLRVAGVVDPGTLDAAITALLGGQRR
jgi:transposase